MQSPTRIIWVILLATSIGLYYWLEPIPPPQPRAAPVKVQQPPPTTRPPADRGAVGLIKGQHPPQEIPQTFRQKLCTGGFQSVYQTQSSRVYSWTNADGAKSYSDRPTRSARDLSTAYATKKQYFSLQLDSTRTLPPLLQENLRRDVTAIYQFLSQKLRKEHLTQTQLRMTIASTPQDFDRIIKKYHSSNAAQAKLSGFYTYRHNRTFVKQSKHTRSVARHEATHAINAVLFGTTPRWFNEGIAVYFGSQDYLQLQQGTTKVSPHRMQTLKETLPLSLTAFLSRNEKDSLNYSIGWSLIYFLNHHANHTASYTARQTIFTQLLHNLARHRCKDPDLITLINENYPGGLTRFENTWAQWIRQS